MVETIINREIVNGEGNTVNIETTTDAELSVNGVNNIINQSITPEGEYTVWNPLSVAINVGASPVTPFFTNKGKSLGYSVGSHTTIYNIDTQESVTISALPYPNWLNVQKASVLNTYILDVEGKSVLKNGVVAQVFSLPEGYTLLYGLAISPDGKYICVTLFNGANYFLTVFQGA